MDEAETLRVYANPYAYINHKGWPAGACACDPIAHTSTTDRRWVGAWLDPDKCSAQVRGPGDIRAPQTEIAFAFSEDVQTIPRTHHYLDRIRAGELVAADADTATAAGLRFEDPKQVLSRARQAGIDAYKAHYGKVPAFASAPPAHAPAASSSTTADAKAGAK